MTLRSNSGLPSIISQMLRGFRRRRTSTITETTISKANGDEAQGAAGLSGRMLQRSHHHGARPFDVDLGGLAEFEHDLIRTRTSEGCDRGKARGVKLGRKPKLTEHQKREAMRRRDRDGEPVREIARSCNVSHSTISRLAA
jgi:hypothetical protein